MSKKIAYIGILTALAVSISWLERLIPLNAAVPGVKIGLSNIVTLVTLYLLGGKYAFFVTIGRVLVVGALFGGLSGIIFGMAGGLLSCAVMFALVKTKKPTVLGVSAAGGVIHNFGQISVAAFVVDNLGMFAYLHVLIISGAAAGIITGFSARLALSALSKLPMSRA